uniref:Uncharacterized protein n=1 Tax=Sphaerodactylus townsendi TaxID=933632 RepID=A0ACB8FA61_9SAUR
MAAAGPSQPQAGAAAAVPAASTVATEESSDSEPEQEPGSPQKLIRKVSTSGQIRQKVLLLHSQFCVKGPNQDSWKISKRTSP